MLKTETVNRVRELFEAGVTGKDIAAQVGIAESTVWHTVRKLHLTARRGPSVTVDGPTNFTALMEHASKWGPVDFDEAQLPRDGVGWIAFIDNKPGYACATKIAALRSAVAFRRG